jgi:hypothetical protein
MAVAFPGFNTGAGTAYGMAAAVLAATLVQLPASQGLCGSVGCDGAPSVCYDAATVMGTQVIVYSYWLRRLLLNCCLCCWLVCCLHLALVLCQQPDPRLTDYDLLLSNLSDLKAGKSADVSERCCSAASLLCMYMCAALVLLLSLSTRHPDPQHRGRLLTRTSIAAALLSCRACMHMRVAAVMLQLLPQ